MAAQAHAQALAHDTADQIFSAAERHRIPITLVILALVAAAVALSVYGFDYYRLPPVLRARSPKHALLRSSGRAGIRLIEAEAYENRDILIAGGGDSAIEAALGVSKGGRNRVTLAYRGDDFKRARERNQEMLAQREAEGLLRVLRTTQVREILATKSACRSETRFWNCPTIS